MSIALTEDSILDLLKDDTKFSAKIKELTDAKRDSETTRAQAVDAVAQLRKQKTDTDNFVAGKKAELQSKQQEHDKAAEEAAKRIELGRQQMIEVMRIKELNETRTAQLDARVSELAQRERTVSATEKSLHVFDATLEKKRLLIVRQQAHIAAMPQS